METREQRGIALAARRAAELERVAAHVWSVPSCTGETLYTVDLDLGYCTCPDYRIQRERGVEDHVCKHMIAAEVVSAKRSVRRQRERRAA